MDRVLQRACNLIGCVVSQDIITDQRTKGISGCAVCADADNDDILGSTIHFIYHFYDLIPKCFTGMATAGIKIFSFSFRLFFADIHKHLPENVSYYKVLPGLIKFTQS